MSDQIALRGFFYFRHKEKKTMLSKESSTETEGRNDLLAADGSQLTPPEDESSTEGAKASRKQKGVPPTYVNELKGELSSLKEMVSNLAVSNRMLEEQLLSYETRGKQVRSTQSEPDPLINIDVSDPEMAKLVAVIKSQQAEIANLKGTVHTTTVSNQERSERESWIDFHVNELAKPLGVPEDKARDALRTIRTRDLGLAGTRVILKMAQESKVGKDAIDQAKEEGKREAFKQLEEQGLYSGAEAKMRGGVATTKATLTANDLRQMTTQQIVNLKITDEELQAAMNRK